MTDKTHESMTIKPEDIGFITVGPDGKPEAVDMTVDPKKDVYVPPQTLDFKDLKAGMVVVFVDQTLNTHPACHVATPHESNAPALAGKPCMVVAVEPEKPGKQVAVCFKEPVAFGHSCDGRVPEGHGAYLRPGHLYLPEAFVAHQAASVHVALEQKRIDAMLAGFVTPATPTTPATGAAK